MSDYDPKTAFDFLAEDQAAPLPPTSVTHLRQASVKTRLFRTVLTCSLLVGGLAVILPLLPDTDSHPNSVAATQAAASPQDGQMTADAKQESGVQPGAFREDVVYVSPERHRAHQRI